MRFAHISLVAPENGLAPKGVGAAIPPEFKAKDPPKFLSSSDIRGGIFISVYNLTVQ